MRIRYRNTASTKAWVVVGQDGGKAGVVEAISRQGRAKHVSAATDTHEATDDILEAVISMRLGSQPCLRSREILIMRAASQPQSSENVSTEAEERPLLEPLPNNG
jgi:hypothetical protein